MNDKPCWIPVLTLECTRGNLKHVKTLLDNGHDIDIMDMHGATPLHEACKEGHLDIVIELLDKGANIEGAGGYPPLIAAINQGEFDIIDELVKRRALTSYIDFDRYNLIEGEEDLIRMIFQKYSNIKPARK